MVDAAERLERDRVALPAEALPLEPFARLEALDVVPRDDARNVLPRCDDLELERLELLRFDALFFISLYFEASRNILVSAIGVSAYFFRNAEFHSISICGNRFIVRRFL